MMMPIIGKLKYLTTWTKPGTAQDAYGEEDGTTPVDTVIGSRRAQWRAETSVEKLGEQPQGTQNQKFIRSLGFSISTVKDCFNK